ncbi:MAG: NAD-dependent epimerase/dehydratase family protein [Thermoguttaceae bacterium]|jgi:nucleoside-diphosphate-sugar epimerase|nr:NAD-dependent epimerase/dehydratase family protein [Thermoguttaceae bacterium]
MKRRTFLQQAGVLLAGPAATAAAAEQKPQESGGPPTSRRPVVLLTSPESDLSRALAAALGEQFHIRTADGPLFRDETGRLDRMLGGVNAVVHVAQPAAAETGAELLDQRTRGTYDLLTVAVAKGVELFVYLGSLDVMGGYDPSFQVAEDWRPVPTSDIGQLSHYMAECVCREFARERKLRAIVLRLGAITQEAAARGHSGDVPRVDQADAVQAVRLALEAHFTRQGAGLQAWNVLHVAADVPDGRFPVTRARRVLGYRPQSAFPE